MKNKIEWFNDDGCFGGQRGLTFDLVTNDIIKWNGTVEKLSIDNIDDVKWCIDMNINSINKKIDDIHSKMKQTEIKYIKIDNGYKISKPLNDNQRHINIDKLDVLTSELKWFMSILLIYK